MSIRALVLASAVAWCGLLALGGCDTVKAPGAGRPDPLPPQYPRVVALERLDRWLRFDQASVDLGESARPMSVSTPLRSIARDELHVHYRYQWFDKDGRLLNPDQGWAYKVLMPRAQDFLAGNALDTRAVDWRLQIRPAR